MKHSKSNALVFTTLFTSLLNAGIVHAGNSSPGLSLNTDTAVVLQAGGTCVANRVGGSNPSATNASTCNISAAGSTVTVTNADIKPSTPNFGPANALEILNGATQTKTLNVTGNITGNGGAVIKFLTSNSATFTLNLNGGTVAGSTSTQPVLYVNRGGNLTINNRDDITANNASSIAVRIDPTIASATTNFNQLAGTVSGVSGTAAISSAASVESNVNVNVSGGTIQTSNATAIVLRNLTGSTGNSITLSGGTVQSTGTAPANGVIDVSGTTLGVAGKGTAITVSSGTITQTNGATGVAIKIGKAQDSLSVTGGAISGQVITANNGVGNVTINAPAFTTGGDFGSAATKFNQLAVTGGALNIGHNIYANTIALSGASASVATTGITLGGNTSLAGTASLDAGANTVAVTGLFDTSAGTPTLKAAATGNGAAFTSNGKFTATTLAMSGNEKVVINLTGGVANGAKFKLIDAASGTGARTLQAANVTSNSATLKFAAQSGNDAGTTLNATSGAAGEDLWFVASFASAAGANYVSSGNVSSTNPSAAAGNALSDIANAGNATGDMLRVINTFNTYSASQLNSEVQKLGPIVNNANTQGSFELTSSGLDDVATRLSALRGDTFAAAPRTGVSAGEDPLSKSFWIKGFGSVNKQNTQNGFDGYKSNAQGVSIGADTEISTDLRAGLAFGYGTNKVDQQDIRQGDSTRINSYQLSAYGSKSMGATYVDGVLAYAQNTFSAQRAAALARTATASWKGNQFAARIGAGYRMPMGSFTVVPVASLEWLRLKQDAYTENGAGALNLQVNSQTTTRIKSSIGAKFLAGWSIGSTDIKPEAHAFWVHDFSSRNISTTAGFEGGGAAFTTVGAPLARDGYDIGLGLTALTGKNSKVTLSYNFEGRSGFTQQAISITGRWSF